jgi:dipeptidyl aminopeptidase/acylaminoacyl peptidase
MAFSQNGKIIARTLFSFPDSGIQKIEATVPDIKSIISLVNFYHITYLSDGLKVKGYLALPKKEGKYPCIIYNRGGRKEGGKITDEYFLTELAPLCSKGYVITASQYRGNDGGEGKEEYGGKDIDDILNLIPLLTDLPQADTSRIGMYGWSRGGMMTYVTLAQTTKIKAAVVKAGVADVVSLQNPNQPDTMLAAMIPGFATNQTELLKQRSAVYFAEKINRQTPLLILQGTADIFVPATQVLDLSKKFYELKQPFRFILYEGGTHSLREYRSDYYQQMINWFDNYLRDRKPWPSLEPRRN